LIVNSAFLVHFQQRTLSKAKCVPRGLELLKSINGSAWKRKSDPTADIPAHLWDRPFPESKITQASNG
jgi:hypothetical protein